MSKHYQALADKAAVHASYAETESDKLYWMSWCQHYTDLALAYAARRD